MVYPAVAWWGDSDDLRAVRSAACQKTEGDRDGHPVHGKAGALNPLLGVGAANLLGADGLNLFGADAPPTIPDTAVCPVMVRVAADPRNLANLCAVDDPANCPGTVVYPQTDPAWSGPSHTGVANDSPNLRLPAASASIPSRACPEEVCAQARLPAAALPLPV
jgi:hypothetical protein